MMGRHRRKRTTTTADYDAMLRRMIRAYGKRVAQDPDVALADLRGIEAELADAVNLGLNAALQAGGSASKLAADLGVSRQAIYKRAALGAQLDQERRRTEAASMRKAAPQAITPEPGPGRGEG
jgi:hypothetical protein